MDFITETRKQLNTPKTIRPEHNMVRLFTALEQGADAFRHAAEQWRVVAGQTPVTWSPNKMTDSTLGINRSLKTGKISLSESAKVVRGGHETFEAAQIKPKVVDAFTTFESAILSIPALAHPGWNLRYKSFNATSHSFLLQNMGLTPYSKPDMLVPCLRYIAQTLDGITTKIDAPLWIVGPKVIPANSAVEAWLLYCTIEASTEDKAKREKKQWRDPNVVIGQLSDMDAIQQEWTRFSKIR